MSSLEGDGMHILEEIVENCSAQKNWSARMLEELARLAEERDGVITQRSLDQLAAPFLEPDVVLEQAAGSEAVGSPSVGRSGRGQAEESKTGASGARAFEASSAAGGAGALSVSPEQAVVQHFLDRVQRWKTRAAQLQGGTGGEDRSGLESGEEEVSSGSQDRLSQLQVDPRLFRSMLLSIKSSPALYRAVLSHHLIGGKANGKPSSSSSLGRSSGGGGGKSSKKKKKEKDKDKEKDSEEGSEAASRVDTATLLGLGGQQPDQLPEPLLAQQAACLVGRAVGDRSLQSILLAVKVLLDAFLTARDSADGSACFGMQVPLQASAGKTLPALEVGALLSSLFPSGSNPFDEAKARAVASVEKARAKTERARLRRIVAYMRTKGGAAGAGGGSEDTPMAKEGARAGVEGEGEGEGEVTGMEEGDDDDAALLEEALAMSIAVATSAVDGQTQGGGPGGAGKEEAPTGEAGGPTEMDIDSKQGDPDAMDQAEEEEGQEEEDEVAEPEDGQEEEGADQGWPASSLSGEGNQVDLSKSASAIRSSYFPCLRGERVAVDGVILALLNFLDEECTAYRAQVAKHSHSDALSSDKPRSSASHMPQPPPVSCIQPHPLTFMLLHALLTDLLSLLRAVGELDDERGGNNPYAEGGPSSDPAVEIDDYCEDISSAASAVNSPMTKKLRLPTSGPASSKGDGSHKRRLRFFAGYAAVSTLRILNLNLLYVARMGLGGSVGLGQVTAPTLEMLTRRKSSATLASLTAASGGALGGALTRGLLSSRPPSGASSSTTQPASTRGSLVSRTSSGSLSDSGKGPTGVGGLASPSPSDASASPSSTLFVVRLRRTVELLMDLQDEGSFYATEVGLGAVRSEAIATWCRGLEFFYPLHLQRQAILLDLLTQQPSRPREKQPEVREAQREALLEALCLRLAQPDMRQHFFEPRALGGPPLPTTPGLDAESKEDEAEGMLLDSEPAFPTDEGQPPGGLSSFLIMTRSGSSKSLGSGGLPLVLELLLEQLQDPWAAPKSKEGTFKARVTLLHALQQRLVEVLTSRTCRGSDATQIEFDPKRRSEHIVLSNHSRTATQRGSKAWGSVMGATGFAPNSGVHQWMVRLDRCEKGHVFIGVCTAEASTRTYVGGDRHGWGMIGTKALWHNRSKVRGDYGEGFGSRCMVRVRLDTDKGTLSLGIGTSDWGVAFEKFPRTELLYPAVGLYQRDDQVTLLPVTADARIRRPLSSPAASLSLTEVLCPVLDYTLRLTRAAQHILDAFDEADRDGRSSCAAHPLLQRLLPSLCAALCLLPPLTSGSTELVMRLVPPLTALVKRLDRLFSRAALFRERPLQHSEVEGTWQIRSGAADNIPAQEYSLTFRTKPASDDDPFTGGGGGGGGGIPSLRVLEGEGEGGPSKVTVEGAVIGSRLRFFETWRQGGTCMVASRLALDGSSFYGTFRDTRSSTSGSISGRRVKEPPETEGDRAMERLGRLEAVMSLLTGKLCCLLMIGVDDDTPEALPRVPSRGGEDAMLASPGEEEEEQEDASNTPNAAMDSAMDEATTGSGAMEADDPMGGPSGSGPAAASEEADEMEAMLKLLSKWRCSRLLSGGLPLADTTAHLQSLKASLQDRGAAEGPEALQAGASEEWWRAAVLQLPTEGKDVLGSPWFQAGASSTELFDDLMAGRGLAMDVDRWVQRHVGESPFTRVGGEPMKVARRAVLSALLRHSGAYQRVAPEWESKGVSNARPGELLLQVWRAAQRVVNWAVRNKQTTGLSFAALADMMEHKARFLMAVLPSPASTAIAQELSTLVIHPPAETERSLLAASPLTTGPLEVEERCVELLSDVVAFFESPPRDIDALRREMMRASMLAFDRGAGLRALHVLIGAGARETTRLHPTTTSTTTTVDSPAGTDRALILSQAVSSALQYLSPAMLGHVDPFSLHEGISSSIAALYAGGSLSLSNGKPTAGSPGGHYLDGLEGCCLHLRHDVRQAFEKLFQQLAHLLSRAVAAMDLDTTVVVLQAWGLVIQPEDHDFLARVGIFRVLQTVLDGVRPEGDVAPSGDTIANRLVLHSRHRVVRAALKVVHLLATQVASSAEDWGQPCVPTPKASDLMLTRQQSGPATLGKSLFDMLYSELLGALRNAACEADGRGTTSFLPSTLSADLSLSVATGGSGSSGGPRADEGEDTELSSDQYCYRIIGLLQAVSSSVVCKRDLTSPKWLRLLLAGLQRGNPSTQRRIFRLLRLLLPSLEPDRLRTRLLPTTDLLESMDEDSNNNNGGGWAPTEPLDDRTSVKPSSSLIDFLLEAIGSALPTTLTRSTTDTDNPRPPSKFASEGTQLTAEAVALARCLMEVPAWAKVLNASFLSSLQGLPSALQAIHTQPGQEDWPSQRDTLCRSLATLGVLGGHLEDLRVGGLVALKPFSIYGNMSDTLALRLASMAHTCGILIAYEPDKRLAEVVLVEREGGDSVAKHTHSSASASKATLPPSSASAGDAHKTAATTSCSLGRGLSLAGGLPIRAVKLSTDDLVAISEVEPYLQAVGPDVAHALFTGLMEQGVGWVENERPLPEDSDVASWDLRVIEAAAVLQTFRAAASCLSSPSFSSGFLRQDSAWRVLLRVAGRPMSRCGLTGVKALQEAWLDMWEQWRSSFYPRPKPAPPRDTAPPPPPPSQGGGSGGNSGGGSGGAMAVGSTASTGAQTSKAQASASSGSGGGPPPLPPRAPEPSSAEQAAAVGTMMEMGFPKELCEVALRRCGNNIEVAVNFCFEHGSDIEQIMAEEQAIQAAAAAVAARGARSAESVRRTLESTILMKQLLEMGFPPSWCSKALAANHNNVNAALTWILSNGEALAAEEEAASEGQGAMGAKQAGEEEEEKVEGEAPAVEGPNPLRVVSGAADMGANLSVEGVARGGFASVGCRGCLVNSGKWYYEATLRTAGCMQIGWCDAGFRGDAQSGDGVGDGPTSWAYDGWRQFKWHDGQTEWGARWKSGDVVGCAVDMDQGTMSFFLNGYADEIGMGVAFTHLSYAGGLYPCASFNRREKMLFNFGAAPLRHTPPPGYRPYIEAVRESMGVFEILRDRFRLGGEDEEGKEDAIEAEEKGEGPEDMMVESASPEEEDGDEEHKAGGGQAQPCPEPGSAMYVEDRMEEEVGTEGMRWQHRYFSPDGLSRGLPGMSTSQRPPASSAPRTPPSPPLTAESAPAFCRKLADVAKELCVLYARRALLTLLATWPALHNTHSLDRLLLLPSDGNHNSDEAYRDPLPIVSLLKVVSVVTAETQAHLAKMSLVTSDAVFANYQESAIHAGGAPCLHAVMPAFSEAVSLALREGRRPVLDSLARSIVQQVYAALCREVSVSDVTGGPSGDDRWSDEDAKRHPNLCLAVWLTGILLANRADASSPLLNHAVLNHAIEAWAVALKSPSVHLKQIACSMVSAILQEATLETYTTSHPPDLSTLLSHLEIPRIEALTLTRMWAERASQPIASRYAQGLADLCATIDLARGALPPSSPASQATPCHLLPVAAMPQAHPLRDPSPSPTLVQRDWEEGLVSCDEGWELWTGTGTQHALDWKRPDKITARSLLDGGDGPPCLLPGHKVVRGLAWRGGEEDGGEGSVGTVEAIVAYDGAPGKGRRVAWPNGHVATYRWGAAGHFEIEHVEVGRDGSIMKRHPYPETPEVVATHGGFGLEQHFGLMLWIKPPPPGTPRLPTDPNGRVPIEGVCEWPNEAAASWVTGERLSDGSLTFTEHRLISGFMSHGWTGRYGQTEWRPGTTYTFAPCLDWAADDDASSSTRLVGRYSFKHTLGGQELNVTGEVSLQHEELFCFDRFAKADGVGISEDGRSAFCSSSECKSTVYGSVGFSRGVHYWEVKIEQEEVGSIFLGVAEKTAEGAGGGTGTTALLGPTGRPVRDSSRYNRWQGWGFINYRASFCWNPSDGSHVGGPAPERAYGDNFHFGDLVGVKLDMDKGVLSFFLDGMKYGEHIIADLGVAFDNLLPTRPRARPRVLFPVVGFRKKGDRVTLTGRWLSTLGVHPSAVLHDVAAVASLLQRWELNALKPSQDWLPHWLYREAWADWRRWRTGRWRRVLTRAQSSAWVDVDTSVDACVRASLLMGLPKPLLAGDRVRVTRRCGKVLEQPEARVVLGAYRGMLWYMIDSQREGGGADRGASVAWCWLACDADGLEVVSQAVRLRGSEGVTLDMLPAFQGGRLRVVYDQAVVREGLEIDTSEKVGEVDHGTILQSQERRLNSSNIARYRISHNGMSGWISGRIRGESEDLIVVRVREDGPPSHQAGGPSSGGESSSDAVGATSSSSTPPSAPPTDRNQHRPRPEELVEEAVKKWKIQVLENSREAMDTDDEGGMGPSAMSDVDVLWCPDSADDGVAEEDLSFDAFVRLCGSMTEAPDSQSRWSVEGDMQLCELLSHAHSSLGEGSSRLTFRSLRAALHHELSSAEVEHGTLLPVGSLLSTSTPDRLLARASLLRVFNDRLARALPHLSISLPEADWERERVGYTELIDVEPSHDDPFTSSINRQLMGPSSYLAASHRRLWRPLCTARRLRALRRLALTGTKRGFWDSVLQATTTATPLHQDEYEDPREIKTIKINRVRASASRLAAVRNINERLRLSVFGQLHKEMRGWASSNYRRAYLGKGHGGQRRAFKVKFLGEGVNDYGGPYRAVFEQIVDELQDDRFPLSQRPGEKCLLPLLVPCPNRMGAVGSNQDKFVLNPGPSSPLALELMQFLGKMVGMAVRHGLPMGLDLPATVWRAIVGLRLTRSHLESYDLLAVRTLQQVESTGLAAEALACTPRGADRSLVPEGWEDLSFSTHLSDGSLISLVPGGGGSSGQDTRVTRQNWRDYIRLAEMARLKESSAMLSAFQDGVAAVLPLELLPLFTDMEVERLICGVREVDVDLLQQCTDYEDVSPEAPHVKAFWEVLHELGPEERTEFLRFTWARSRMPSSAKDFPMNFKIQGPAGGAKDNPDAYLPHAQTCFFSLSLPQYSSKEILRKKLLLAIKNSPNMDADVRLHTAEGWSEA